MAEKKPGSSYDPAPVEQKWYPFWESQGYFTADPKSEKPRFSIVIPPPNVTGSLHMGHALQHTLHDILVRWKRMNGYNTLWLPGTDHASIAVHYVLDKQLAQEKRTRFDLGRERFLEMAWKWKETSGGNDSQPDAAHGGVLRLDPRTIHHGRRVVQCRARGLRSSL